MAFPQQGGPQIDVVFDLATGEVKAEASGFTGQACSLDVDALMKAIGTTTKRTPKRPEKDQNVARTQRT